MATAIGHKTERSRRVNTPASESDLEEKAQVSSSLVETKVLLDRFVDVQRNFVSSTRKGTKGVL